jgi:hypothetical protein
MLLPPIHEGCRSFKSVRIRNPMKYLEISLVAQALRLSRQVGVVGAHFARTQRTWLAFNDTAIMGKSNDNR